MANFYPADLAEIVDQLAKDGCIELPDGRKVQILANDEPKDPADGDSSPTPGPLAARFGCRGTSTSA